MRRWVVCLAVACLATTTTSAHAKLTLTFSRDAARPGDSVRVTFGSYFTSKNKTVFVYLVRAPLLGDVLRPANGGGIASEGPPPRRAGVHRVGRTLSDKAGLTFQVPATRSGRYAAVLWCPTCPVALLARHQSGVPDDAAVPRRTLLQVRARG